MVNEVKLLESENQLNRMRLKQLEKSLLDVCKDMNNRLNVLENKVDTLLNELKVVTVKDNTTHGNWDKEEFDYSNR